MIEEILEHGGRRWKRLDDGALRIWDDQGWRQPTTAEKGLAPPSPVAPAPPEPEAPPAPPEVPTSWRITNALGKMQDPKVAYGVAGVIALIVVLVFKFSIFGGSATHQLTGILTAPECGDGYDVENASVEITDETGALIAATSTGFDAAAGGNCYVTWSAEVPDAEFYQLEVGTHGAPSYSFEEMERMNWTVRLSLGD